MRPPRKDLLNSNTLHGQEIVWVEDPVAAAMMQIQGSGRILLENQQILRLSFAGTNQQRYQSIAQWLIDRKELTTQQASMQSISEWAKKNPQRINELLDANPRYVFFKILRDQLSLKDGPIGSIGVSLTPGRSIAVDWQAIPKGAPMFLSLRILMIINLLKGWSLLRTRALLLWEVFEQIIFGVLTGVRE